MEPETRQCKKCQQDFILEPDDFSFYEKMDVPAPKICPDCRFKMRAIWRNETSLYSRKCAKTGKSILTNYNSKSLYTVVSQEYYNSDNWDAKDFAREYDFKKPFFEQLKELFLNVPKPTTFASLTDGENINSEYSNYASGLKNCYMVFNTGPAEEIMYSRGIRNCREITDCYYINLSSELMYECINCSHSSKIIYGENSNNCVECTFILNCNGCTDCFGCVNLRNASNQIFNKQYTKEEYTENINSILGSYEKLEKFKKQFIEFKKDFPMKENHNLKSIGSLGDYLFECKNVKNSFECLKGEYSSHLFAVKNIKDSSGVIGYGFNSEQLLECASVGYSSNMIGTITTTDCQNIMYSCFLRNCNDCIGCDGLKNASYCILNKQYTKEEYEKLKEHIINELKEKELYGLMMPLELCPFAYNETIAQDNMPLTKEEALTQGFRWEDDIQKTEGKETMKPEEISDHIKDVPDSITNEILRCIDCNRNYKITAQELLFYRKIILPIPRKCFYCRHKDRVIRRGPYKFWKRNCDKCQKEITTNYAPNRPEIIYCEKCYQAEVY